jgi:hypothetical protein
MQAAPMPERKIACADAYERAQLRRNERKLRSARADLVSCLQVCPAMVRPDCLRWLGEVDADLPTVVFEARDGRANEIFDVRVRVDREPLVERLDGGALPVDPGVHTFLYERDGQAREQVVTVREGEKNRKLMVTFEGHDGSAPGGSFRSTPAPIPTRPVPPAAYVAGAAALLGFGGFVWFGATGLSQRNELAATCSPHCPLDEVAQVRTRYIVADVCLGAAAIAAGVAVWLYLSRPSSHP